VPNAVISEHWKIYFRLSGGGGCVLMVIMVFKQAKPLTCLYHTSN